MDFRSPYLYFSILLDGIIWIWMYDCVTRSIGDSLKSAAAPILLIFHVFNSLSFYYLIEPLQPFFTHCSHSSMVFYSFACTLLCLALFLINGTWADSHQAYRPFGDVYREAKMKPWNSTQRMISQPSGAEADPSNFRFYKEETSGTYALYRYTTMNIH
jgi:hypothetical protein